jgi:hypothetical protein
MPRQIAKFLSAALVGSCLMFPACGAFAQAPQYDDDGTPYETRPVKICGADPDDDVSAPDYMCAQPPPPADFDPFSATPEELEKYGYPPKPTDPEALETWSEIVSVRRKRHQAPCPTPLFKETRRRRHAHRVEARPIRPQLARPDNHARRPQKARCEIPFAHRPTKSSKSKPPANSSTKAKPASMSRTFSPWTA